MKATLSLPRIAAAVLLTAMLTPATQEDQAAAQGRNRHRRAAAAAAGHRQRLIEKLQRQRDAAQDVLATARSQTSLSQQALEAAALKLSFLRTELEQSRLSAKDAEKTVREIEAEILEEQPADSEYIRAKHGVGAAKQALHREVLRVLPQADPAKLTPAQREMLEDDVAYRREKLNLEIAAKALDRVRQKLFQADADWLAAHKDLDAARQEENDHQQAAASAGVGSLDDKQDLRTAQALAAAAGSVIDVAEARLKRLGADPNQKESRKPKRSMSDKKRK